ncbi:MAG: hypothetical protein ACREIU_14245, partial [Planctomycetota bacterium]
MNGKLAGLVLAASAWGVLAPRAPARGVLDARQEKTDAGKPEKEKAGKEDPGKEKAAKGKPSGEPEKKKDPAAFLKEKPAADLDGDGKLSLEEVLALKEKERAGLDLLALPADLDG